MYKEFVQIILKIQNNFAMRDLNKLNEQLMQAYLQQLYDFTIASYKTPSSSVKFHASKLNYVW